MKGFFLAGLFMSIVVGLSPESKAQTEPAPEHECTTDECRFEELYDEVRAACRDHIQQRVDARSTNDLTRPFFSRYRILPNGTIFYYGSALEITNSNGVRMAGTYTCVWLTDNTLGMVVLNQQELL